MWQSYWHQYINIGTGEIARYRGRGGGIQEPFLLIEVYLFEDTKSLSRHAMYGWVI